MKITLRPYQRLAIDAALKGLRSKFQRALVVLATGLGKTLTAAFIAKEFKAKRVLFLVHNNFILTHAVDEFRMAFGEKTEMAVYNGMTKEGAENAQFVFATWQTMGRNLKRWAKNHFDLIIVDEAHHTEAATYRPVVKYFTGSKLGITATPDRADDADIRDIFGQEVANVSLEEAMARRWLPRVEYHVVTDKSLDDDALQEIVREIREEHRRFSMAEVNRRLFIRKRDEEIGKHIEGYKEKAVVFCANIKHAERMHRAIRSSSVFHSKTGNGQQETWGKNNQALTSLRAGIIKRVCVVNAFNEGVNVPDVGLVAFCRVTSAMTIFRQQLGRGLRPGKKKLIVLDFVGNLERIQLVQAMMKDIADIHESVSSEEEREREGYKRDKFEVSGAGFEFTFSDRIVDLMEVLDHVERNFYPTWQEAGKAAIRLGIYFQNEYRRRYREDLKLPCDPWYFYPNYPGDTEFFGRTKYLTWQEAGVAAKVLGIKSSIQYKKGGYKLDPRLHSNPSLLYSDWPGWAEFLGGRGRNFYLTSGEVLASMMRLGIQSQPEYAKRYKEDPRLPSNPYSKYPDFPGFDRSTAKKSIYKTWQEAGKAATRLGITTSSQYESEYKLDPLLPSRPSDTYSDFPGWWEYLGKISGRSSDHYETWQEAGKAARKLVITGKVDYANRRKADLRLPGSPRVKYPDFPGWAKFLGKEK